MNCSRIDERLLHLTSRDSAPAFSAEERNHLGSCPRCRTLVDEFAAAAERIASASGGHRPGPAYWASIMPRVRERAGARRIRTWSPEMPGLPGRMMPAAAVVIAAILISIVVAEPPVPRPEPGIFATLSDIELFELRQSGKYSGILESPETIVGEETTVADFIADLLPETDEDVMFAFADPEAVLRLVGDAEYTDILSNLEPKQSADR